MVLTLAIHRYSPLPEDDGEHHQPGQTPLKLTGKASPQQRHACQVDPFPGEAQHKHIGLAAPSGQI